MRARRGPGLLEAEAIAWPLVDEVAFRGALLAADPETLGPGFEQRARALGEPERPADLAAGTWRSPEGDPSILGMLRRVAAARLEPDGGATRVCLDPRAPARSMLAWRWLGLALPPHLLVAARWWRPPPLAIRLLPAGFLPRGPLAHQHLHAGAVLPFELIWTRLMTVGGREPFLTQVAKDADARLGGQPLARWVRVGIAARPLLARFARDPAAGEAWAEDPGRAAGRPGEHWAAEALVSGSLPPRPPGVEPLRDLALTRLLREALPARTRAPRRVAEVWAQDPIGAGEAWPEGWLMQRLLAARLSEGVQRLFLQYLRVKLAVYRRLVSDPAAPTLEPFVTTYDHLACYRCDLDPLSLEVATSDDTLGRIDAVELRTSPPREVAALLDLVSARPAADPVRRAGASEPEWGWTLHFIRATETRRGARAGWATAESLRARIRDHERRAETLIRALRRWPQLLAHVRGLDVATLETEGPLWSVTRALRRARAASVRAAAGGLPGVEPLRLTLHAGEDFRHLLTGLRALYEPLATGLLEVGDRLGHAIALTTDVDAWFDAHPQVRVPRLDRLLDLLALRDSAVEDGWGLSGEVALRISDEVSRLARELWPRLGGRGTDEPVALWRALGDASLLLRAGALERVPVADLDGLGPAALLRDVLADQRTATAAWELVPVETARERESTRSYQAAVHRRVAAACLTIETNPSSNLLISGAASPLAGEALRRRPVHEAPLLPVLAVSLSSDDPVSFSTSLGDEYAYAWAGVVDGATGVDPQYALAWLDDLARTSWRSRFTRPRAAGVPAPGADRRTAWIRAGGR